jgi:hypothetical protein
MSATGMLTAASTRAALLKACATNDQATVVAAGWWPIYRALRAWWARSFDSSDLAAYCDLLGDQDPEQILAALRTLGDSEWRPPPSAVLRALHPDDEQRTEEGKVVRYRRDLTPTALERARALLAAGESTCECVPRRTAMTIDGGGIVRCDECGRLDPGQADTATEELSAA